MKEFYRLTTYKTETEKGHKFTNHFIYRKETSRKEIRHNDFVYHLYHYPNKVNPRLGHWYIIDELTGLSVCDAVKREECLRLFDERKDSDAIDNARSNFVNRIHDINKYEKFDEFRDFIISKYADNHAKLICDYIDKLTNY